MTAKTSNDVIGAALTDSTGQTGAYLIRTVRSDAGFSTGRTRSMKSGQYGEITDVDGILHRWYWNQSEGIDAVNWVIAAITDHQQSANAKAKIILLSPDRGELHNPGGAGDVRYFDYISYLQNLIKSKGDTNLPKNFVDDITPLIRDYQKLEIIKQTNIFWTKDVEPGPWHWGPDQIENFLERLPNDTFLEDLKTSKRELRRLIGRQGLQAVKELTFIARGMFPVTNPPFDPQQIPATPEGPGAIGKNAGTDYTYPQLYEKSGVPSGRYERVSSGTGTSSWARPIFVGSPFATGRFTLKNDTNNKLGKQLVEVGLPTDIDKTGVYSKPKEEVPPGRGAEGSYGQWFYMFLMEDPQGAFSAEQIAQVIALRHLIKVDAFSFESFDKLQEDDLDPDMKSLEEAIAAEVNRRPDITEIDIDSLRERMASLQTLRGQCFLLKQIFPIARENRKRLNNTKSKIGTKNRIYQHTRMVANSKNPAATLNKLTQGSRGQENLLEFRTADFAKMLPYIKIYKVQYDVKTRQRLKEVEFKFPNFTNVDPTRPRMDILEELENPLYQEYGLKSFDWKFIGSDPFSYANDIECSMVLYFQDFEQLQVLRTDNSTNQKYRLLDLLVPTESTPTKRPSKVQDSNYFYDIRVDVGLSGPASIRGFELADSIRSLFMTMVDYDISFNQEGFFELSINYKSRLEQTFYDKATSILGKSGGSNSTLIANLEEDLKDLREQDAPSVLIEAAEEDLQAARLDLTQGAFSSIIQSLFTSKSVYSFRLHEGFFRGAYTGGTESGKEQFTKKPIQNTLEFSKTSAFPSIELINNLPSTEDEDAPSTEIFLPTRSSSYYNIGFFYLIDLVEAASKLAFKNAGTPAGSRPAVNLLKDAYVALTDHTMYNPLQLTEGNREIIYINLGDIPIHMDLFVKFYYEKVIKYNVTTYPLMKFIRDVVSYCMLNIMSDCIRQDNIRSSLKTGFLSFKKEKNATQDPFSYYGKKYNTSARNLRVGNVVVGSEKYNQKASLTEIYYDMAPAVVDPKSPEPTRGAPKIASSVSQEDCAHTLVISSTSFSPKLLKITPDYQTKKTADHAAGIYHLQVGSAKGIVKNISFAKTDQAYLREQRMTTTDDDFGILSNVFDVSIDLYGNTLFYPGQRVFISLGERFSSLGKPWSQSFANIMGLGGYHIITSVSNTISEGKFETKIEARFETSGDGNE